MSGPNTNYDPVEVAALDPVTVEAARVAALEAAASATTLDELKAARTTHQGDRSALAQANREIGALPPSGKAAAGKLVGGARGAVAAAYARRQRELEDERDARILAEESLDLTMPSGRPGLGARHPLSLVSERIEDIFIAMGWEIADGPEVESEWLTFDALNLGPDHPARQMQDTFFVAPAESSGLVLRTHTSPVQIRSLLDRPLPVYVVCPGKVYRADEYDATHLPVFHQIEGLVVDKGITLADLRGSLDHFARAMFGDTRTRMRPNYFPFTEPSAEVDLQCFVCHGTSVGNPDQPCRTCKSEGWIEWGGCGVVNPRVLEACGVDSSVYSGFAFGMGVDRTLMFRNDAEDMRDMIEGDVRYSRSLQGLAR